jgi:hypothetical protein
MSKSVKKRIEKILIKVENSNIAPDTCIGVYFEIKSCLKKSFGFKIVKEETKAGDLLNENLIYLLVFKTTKKNSYIEVDNLYNQELDIFNAHLKNILESEYSKNRAFTLNHLGYGVEYSEKQNEVNVFKLDNPNVNNTLSKTIATSFFVLVNEEVNRSGGKISFDVAVKSVSLNYKPSL